MGFGCNAVGVTGCRIIDSKRERMIAVLTNAFVPCNGRFPTLIAIISMFLAVSMNMGSSIVSALILSAFIIISIFATMLCSWLLSKTLLRGEASSFALELPPYRRPDIGKTIIRSVFDRTLFVLGRSVAVAAPAGLVLWILANLRIGDATVLVWLSQILDPLGEILGMDGAILLAFVLALPANEILIPIVLMVYTAGGSLMEYSNLSELMGVLASNGWTVTTALCVCAFTLFHFPCATTLLTIKRETGSIFWTAVSALLPTVLGILVCLAISFIFGEIFSL